MTKKLNRYNIYMKLGRDMDPGSESDLLRSYRGDGRSMEQHDIL